MISAPVKPPAAAAVPYLLKELAVGHALVADKPALDVHGRVVSGRSTRLFERTCRRRVRLPMAQLQNKPS